MQDVLDTLQRMSDLESVQVQTLSGTRVSVLVKSWRYTSNGEIDEGSLASAVRDALQDETLQVEAYQDGEEWALVYVNKKFPKGVSK